MKFKQIDPSEIDNSREGTRGRVSYPYLKAFLETGYYASEVDLSDSQRKAASLFVLLKSYADNHDLPVKVMMRRNRLYLIRLDVDEKGNKISDWLEQRNAAIKARIEEREQPDEPAVPLSDDVVKQRSGLQKIR